MKNRIALLGQPNSGKSTVFNALTGSRQHVGNWPGKTVEKIDGYYRVGKKQIEDGIVKPAISRKKGKQALNVAIIFPYYFFIT